MKTGVRWVMLDIMLWFRRVLAWRRTANRGFGIGLPGRDREARPDRPPHVTVSLDGPAEINDKHRVDFKGRGTLALTLRGIDRLQATGIEPGLISVCNPSTDPELIVAYIVEEFGITHFDILPPDATHSDNPPPIADYFIIGYSTSGSIAMPSTGFALARLMNQRFDRPSVGVGHVRAWPDPHRDALDRRMAGGARCAAERGHWLDIKHQRRANAF